MKIPRLFSLIGAGIVLLLFFSFSTIVYFITDLWWFKEVGYMQLFIKPFIVKIVLTLIATFIVAAFLFINFFISHRSKISWVAFIPKELFGYALTLENSMVRKISIGVSIIVSLLFGLVAASYWQDVLKFMSITLFNENDPIFKKDVGFYIFSLPVLQLIQSFAQILILISLIGSFIIYLLRGSFDLTSLLSKLSLFKKKSVKKIKIETKARVHLAILTFLFLVIASFGTYLSLFKLLIVPSGPIFGAAYTDATLAIPIIKISTIITLLIAILTLVWGISGKLLPLVGAVFLYLIIGAVSGILPLLFQKLVVAPNELKMETPFLKYNIAGTRKAYNLDKIEEREISADKPLTASDIASNNLTIKNVRLWDRDPLLSTFSQIQEIRTYYEFVSVDNDRYMIDGEIRQIMLSPRELASDSLPTRNWINERLTFTHGYGVAAGPVNQVTAEGLPMLFVKDLPPKSEKKELTVSKPQIYFGELTSDHVFVKTKSKEFDYPRGEENVYTEYQGKGGVKIDSLLKRLLYSIRFNSLKLLLSEDITKDSRVLYYRNIKERVNKIAPFLTFDRDPYAVVTDGRIYWIFDAYTKTSLYPYSQPLSLNEETINYIRNSVKVVIDAYNGTVVFYQADNNDPIIKTYTKIFPNTFKPLSQMPKGLIPHLRYPEDIFSLQTAIYTIYHMDDAQIFYNKEDQWETPTIQERKEPSESSNGSSMGPRHIIMKLPGEKKEEFILMLPFTPRNKDNLSAWMVARNDRENYGKLMVYQFPKQKLIYGPKQVISRINQDAEVSRQISLWDQRGSQVIQGPLLVIPIEESLIYVRPLYLKAETGKIPELKRVIVAYENKIAMEETLEEALAKILGSAQKNEPEEKKSESQQITKGQALQNILKDANNLYDEAIKAQKEGNWAAYGEIIKKLGETLKK